MRKLVLFLILSFAIADQSPLVAVIDSTKLLPTFTLPSPETNTVFGGQALELNLDVQEITEYWAGFIGRVTDYMVLGSGTGKMYSWSLSSVSGYVYMATNPNVIWSGLDGSVSTADIISAAIWSSDPQDQNLESTFKYVDDGDANDLDSTPENQCGGDGTYYATDPRYVRTYTTNVLETNSFITCALKDSSGVLVFKASISQGATGFNGKEVDYQALVPANSSGVIYYFFKG